MKYEWDPHKDQTNRKKHGVSFSEAAELFGSSEEYLEIYDSEHSFGEDRFMAIGKISRGVVVVVFTEREDDVIRAIGARFATNKEIDLYQDYMGRML